MIFSFVWVVEWFDGEEWLVDPSLTFYTRKEAREAVRHDVSAKARVRKYVRVEER